jgi:hypothetical protein
MENKHSRGRNRRRITLKKQTVRIITTNEGSKEVPALVYQSLALTNYNDYYYVTHIPTGRSIVGATKQREARKALEALADAPIDWCFEYYCAPGSPGRLKYDLSEALTRYTLAKLLKNGLKLVDTEYVIEI